MIHNNLTKNTAESRDLFFIERWLMIKEIFHINIILFDRKLLNIHTLIIEYENDEVIIKTKLLN